MLKKLLKYDLISIFKFLLIFYGLSLFFGILTRIFLNIENSFAMNLIGQICSGCAISMMFSVLINNLMRLWVRFRQNFYGDESYLTHTLPIEKKTLYLSKILSAFITLFVSVLVIALTIFIVYYSKENFIVLKNMLLPIINAYNSTVIIFILSIIFIFFLEMVNLLQAGFTGMILGHRKNNTKVGFSVLFGFITYFVIQTILLLIIFIIALFNKDIMNLFITNEVINLEILKVITYSSIIIYTISILICCFINIKLFNKGVDVD